MSEAIGQSGYRPNLAARSLVTARSNFIGIFVPPTGSHFLSEPVRSAVRACREHGYNLALEEFDGSCDSAAEAYMRGIRQLRCDGVILPPVGGDDVDLLALLDDGAAADRGDCRSGRRCADDAAGLWRKRSHLPGILIVRESTGQAPLTRPRGPERE